MIYQFKKDYWVDWVSVAQVVLIAGLIGKCFLFDVKKKESQYDKEQIVWNWKNYKFIKKIKIFPTILFIILHNKKFINIK